jgi:hypothetical protein
MRTSNLEPGKQHSISLETGEARKPVEMASSMTSGYVQDYKPAIS